MKKVAQIVTLCTFLASCSVMDASRLLNPDKPSLEVSAQVGKTNNQEKSTIKIETGQDLNQDAENISNDKNYKAELINNITQGMSTFELLLFVLMAGVAIPTFGQIYVGIKTILKDIWRGLFIGPLKDIIKTVRGN